MLNSRTGWRRALLPAVTAAAAVALALPAAAQDATTPLSGQVRAARDAIAAAADGSALLDPCMAAMYATMATGSVLAGARFGQGGCDPCITAGLAAASMTATLADPSLSNQGAMQVGGTMSAQAVRDLPGWMSAGMRTPEGLTLSQAAAAQASANAPAPGLSGCSAAPGSSTLPGPFASTPTVP